MSEANKKAQPAGALRWAGPPLAAIYGLGVKIHRAISTARIAPLATICAGNLTAGGTGKTPAVKWLARGLAERGRKPAVLLRGYKAQESDEAAELQTALAAHNIPVLIGANRYKNAVLARKRGCDVAILDDGFQHWRLARDLDIVLIDATAPFGGGHLLPWGRLREPVGGLARAGVIIITRADSRSAHELAELKTLLALNAPKAIYAHAIHRPVRVSPLPLREGAGEGVEMLSGLPVLAACGIGNPAAFQRTLEQSGARVLELVAYDDHHAYTAADMRGLDSAAARLGAKAIVVTSKDAAKMAPLASAVTVPLWALEVEFAVTDGAAAVWERVAAALNAGDMRRDHSGAQT